MNRSDPFHVWWLSIHRHPPQTSLQRSVFRESRSAWNRSREVTEQQMADELRRLEARNRRLEACLVAAADGVPPKRRLGPSDYPRGSVKDMLAHLDAWHRMFLEWERVGRTGEVAEMPAPGYKWKESPALNMEIHERDRGDSWDDVVARLRASHGRCRSVIETYSDQDLFTKKRYR